MDAPFVTPTLDYHALAPEIVLVGALAALILYDVFSSELNKRVTAAIAQLGLLGAIVPILTLWAGDPRSMFDGAYAVDKYAIILKGLFLAAGYLVVLISVHYIGEGDYWEGEYYTLLLSSVLGMMLMASARDLISVFVALEVLSIPGYMLAAWRKRDLASGEAGVKYYLMGVFATAVLLYGMSLVYGLTGQTQLRAIADAFASGQAPKPVLSLAIVFVLVGFAFKVSAVPFHTWAPDTYEGAPTPVTAFLAVASKTAGFVALMNVVAVAFHGQTDVLRWMLVPLAAITMTVGNLIAVRQTNIIRMLAYSGVAQAGYMLCPLAVMGTFVKANDMAAADNSVRTLLVYLIIYAAMNLGGFAVVIAVARRTGSGEISSMRGMFQWAPGMMMALAIFLGGFAGIPPAGGWFGKFAIFKTTMDAGALNDGAGYFLAFLIGINSVIAAFYYVRVIWTMVSGNEGDLPQAPLKSPAALRAAVFITAVAVVAIGVVPTLVSHITDNATLIAAATGR